MTSGRARRRRRWPWLLLALVVVAGGGGAFYWYQTRDALADPTTVALPAQSASSPKLQEYFAGPGAPLLTMLHQTDHLPEQATTTSCTQVATALDHIAAPNAMLAAANGVPDAAVRTAVTNHLNAVGQYLNDCGGSPKLTDQAQKVTFTATVLDRLLTRAGVK